MKTLMISKINIKYYYDDFEHYEQIYNIIIMSFIIV